MTQATSKTCVNKSGDVLNAAFHKSKKIRELIEYVGCRVIFPPTYSPDLNKIEKFWD